MDNEHYDIKGLPDIYLVQKDTTNIRYKLDDVISFHYHKKEDEYYLTFILKHFRLNGQELIEDDTPSFNLYIRSREKGETGRIIHYCLLFTDLTCLESKFSINIENEKQPCYTIKIKAKNKRRIPSSQCPATITNQNNEEVYIFPEERKKRLKRKKENNDLSRK